MTDWPEFYFARHGETDWNRERRYQGGVDIPLNELGRRQADANGVLLKQLLHRDNIDPNSINWYASPLSRARETMERMRAAFEMDLSPIIFDERLVEISFGVLEGRLHAEINDGKALAPGEREADYWDYRPEDGENYADLAARLNAFAETLEGLPVVVAHGGVQRALRHVVEGVSRKEAVNWSPPQGVIAHFLNGNMSAYHAMSDSTV